MKGGWNMFNLGARAGVALISAAAIASVLGQPTFAQQGKEPSDKVVNLMMRFAWQLTPPKFSSPAGKTIEVDKKKPKEVTIPFEAARQVVLVGHRSAHAQLCGLAEEHVANFKTLMRREEKSEKWTDQQLLFIQRLHQATYMYVTGKAGFEIETEDGKVIKSEAKTNITEECTDAKRKNLKDQIKTYIKDGAALPHKTAEPAKGGAQKK